MLPAGRAALRTNVDGTARGGPASFLNHACDGGNVAQLVVRRAGEAAPAGVLCAARDVAAGEELCYAYGPPNPGPRGRRCACATPACLGFMPHEDV